MLEAGELLNIIEFDTVDGRDLKRFLIDVCKTILGEYCEDIAPDEVLLLELPL